MGINYISYRGGFNTPLAPLRLLAKQIATPLAFNRNNLMHPNNCPYVSLSPAQFDLLAKHFEIVSMSTLPAYEQIIIHFRLSSIYVRSTPRPEAVIIRRNRCNTDENSLDGPSLVYSNDALLDFFNEYKVEFKK